jgi:methionyl-tRNA synthetase
MPEKSSEILDRISVSRDPSARGFAAAKYGADYEYGLIEKPAEKREFLFPPLLVED